MAYNDVHLSPSRFLLTADMPTATRAIRGNITALAVASHCGQPVSRIPGVMHTCRVTKDAPTSPWSVTTKNLVLNNSRVGSERADLDALPQSAGVRFTAAGQRSWGTRRPVNAGLLALAAAECAQYLASREP
jgi:hypothetical protein